MGGRRKEAKEGEERQRRAALAVDDMKFLNRAWGGQ